MNEKPRKESIDFVEHGLKTIVRLCDSKWPRLLPIQLAAAYCGLSQKRFREDPFLKTMIRTPFGVEIVDKEELDRFLTMRFRREKIC